MCDLCIAAESASFVYPEAKLGFTGEMIAGLAGRIPYRIASELCRTASRIHAQALIDSYAASRHVRRQQRACQATLFSWDEPQLLHHRELVEDGPVFRDLAVGETQDIHPAD